MSAPTLNYRIIVRDAERDNGEFSLWEDGQLSEQTFPREETPLFVRNGTYNETVEFISAIKENRAPQPSPADVLQSVELCHAIQL